MKKLYLRIKGGCVQELLSRNLIMKAWAGSLQNDKPCCPYCRDVLKENETGDLYCADAMCKNEDVYEKEAKRIKA